MYLPCGSVSTADDWNFDSGLISTLTPFECSEPWENRIFTSHSAGWKLWHFNFWDRKILLFSGLYYLIQFFKKKFNTSSGNKLKFNAVLSIKFEVGGYLGKEPSEV